jgi:glucose-1-phosphate thymidylyltransferase
MKALVLARGLARRMREPEPGATLDPSQARAAAAGLKAMMPVGSADEGHAPRPFLDYVLSSLADAGCGDIGLVLGPEHEHIRQRYVSEVRPHRVTVTFIIQPEPMGTAHAVLCGEPWAGSDPFLVLNADNLYPVPVLQALVALTEPGLPAFTREALVRDSNIPPERIASFALITVDADGHLTSIVEKPDPAMVAAAGDRALVSMNCWRFDARIFDACRRVRPSPRRELELPMAVAVSLDDQVRYATVPGSGAVLDLSRQSDVAEVSRRLSRIIPHL